MPTKLELVHRVFAGETRQERVRCFAMLVVWFSVGALVVSGITPFLLSHHDGSVVIDATGGVLSAVTAAVFKLV
jgi:hypothetical protein